ncbi:MAG: class I adenylate-forming enzyme family protein [Alphaproteobacteria bacterium]|nr:class I adenylate-forming enzyme family protein [Alphaproteobacteria bacterium]
MITNIGQLLERHAIYRADVTAFICEGKHFSYRDFNIEIQTIAQALQAKGLQKGDHIATLLPNGVALMALYWVAAVSGLVIVPASPLLQANGIKELLKDSDSKALFFTDDFAKTIEDILPTLELLSKDFCFLVGGSHSDWNCYDDLLEEGRPEEFIKPEIDEDDLYNIMYSSGTTGAPKGIMHSHKVRAHYCTGFASAFRMTPESVVLHTGSIVFNGAMLDLMPWMFLGATYILHPTFDVEAMIADIEKHKVTHIVMVPAQIIALLNHKEFDPEKLSSLEMILSVGAPLLMTYKERLNATLPGRFYELYGLTEGFATVLDKTVSMQKTGSVGCPLPFYEMKIMRSNDTEAAIGEAGEIVGRAPLMSSGYYKRPTETANTFRDGWIYTGDIGRVDEDGHLYLVDRLKDMIITGGVNVYPRDIEEIIIAHPDISDVSVFGIENDKWGEVPVAAVIFNTDTPPPTDEIIHWINQRVSAKFQRISDVFPMISFPRNVAQKTLKRDIKLAYLKSITKKPIQ